MRIFVSLILSCLIVLPVWANSYVEIVGADEAVKAKYKVEIADENEERRIGLMDREELDEEAGMLFVFDPPQQASFWMMNTLIPLDMIFADEEGIILHVEESATPHDLTSRGPKADNVAYVLEVNGGQSEKNAFELGDRLAISK